VAENIQPMKPSPQKIRESSQEFRKLVQGNGSAERYVAAVQKESRSYVSGVRAGRYRNGRAAA
jgi:hypothetical protein